MNIYQDHKKVLGGEADLAIRSNNPKDVPLIFDQIWSMVTDFESRFSRFREISELSNVNKTAGRFHPVSQEFISLYQSAVKYWKKTDGIYNPAILHDLIRAGYNQSFEKGSDPNFEVKISRGDLALNEVLLEKESIKIPSEMALDFGGIGKGYLLDALYEKFDKILSDFWFSLGGDLIFKGQKSDSESWNCGIQNPYLTDQDYLEIQINQPKMAVATSATHKRRGKHNQKNWHHLINPQTGEPAVTDLISATVISPEAVEADILASCIIILGSQNAKTFIDKFPNIQALCFYEDQSLMPFVLGQNIYRLEEQLAKIT